MFAASANRLSRHGRILVGIYALCQSIALTLDLGGVYAMSLGLRSWVGNKNLAAEANPSEYLKFFILGAVLLVSRSLCLAMANIYILRRLATEESSIALKNYSTWQAQPLTIRKHTDPSFLKIVIQETPNIRVQMILIQSISVFIETINFVAIFIIMGFINPFVSIGSIIFYLSVGFCQHHYLSSASSKVGQRTVDSLSKVYDFLDIAYRLTDVLEVMPSRSFESKLFESRQDSAIALVDSNLIQLLPRLTLELSIFLGIAFVLGFSNYFDPTNGFEIPLGLFLLLSFRLVPILSSIQSKISQILTWMPFLQRDTNLTSTSINDSVAENLISPNHPTLPQSHPHEPRIRLEKVNFKYPESTKSALIDVDFQLQRGLIYAIVGPNGSGKSTLMNILLGSLRPTTGSVVIECESELVIGYVPQMTELFNGSIAQNIAIEWNPEFIDFNRIADLCIGIPQLNQDDSDFMSRKSDELSGGQKQMLCLMRALYRSPDLLLLDEANSFLDDSTESLFDDLIHLNKNKRFTLMVSHRVRSILASDVILLMDSGQILDIGSVAEIRRRHPEFEKLLFETRPLTN